mgnify:CR=1 FL=1
MRIPPLGGQASRPAIHRPQFRGPCPAPQPLKGRKERMPREKKTEIITLRVTPRTKAVIQARAKSVNKTVTDYLCLCGLGKEIVQVEGLDKVLPS